MQKKWFLYVLVAVAATAMACGGETKTPASPSATASASTDAAADGSTLKINAPTLTSPANGTLLTTMAPTLVLQNATSKFVPQAISSYQFVVVDAGNATVVDSGPIAAGSTSTSYTVPSSALKPELTYRWRARGVSGTAFGPWSGYFSFTTPRNLTALPGFITATTLWDPLTDGRSIGTPTGMEFTKDVGARTISNASNIRYDLLQTISAGEYSFYVYNLNPLSVGDKTKLMSMQEGTSDITTNDYRFTIEKRGASYTAPGQVRIRVIAGDSGDHGRIFDSAPLQPPLVKAVWYFARLTWGGGRLRLQIINADGTTGALGSTVLDYDMGYGSYTYKPVPHVAWVGAPVGRAGEQDASVPNMTVKWVWIGAAGTTRPGFNAAAFDGPGE